MTVEDYLRRLGVSRPSRADAAALRALHRAHLMRVPFENLDISMGEPISLDVAALSAKVIDRGRGGFCYELNGLFATLLAELGFEVTRLGASVWSGERFGPPLDHLALRVRCADGGAWLADVGFGAHSTYPLRWDTGVEQDDPAGRFRLEVAQHGDVIVMKDGVVQYRVEARPRELNEFAAMCWYQQHSPQSHFSRSVVCSRSTENGRISLAEDRLIVTENGRRSELGLADDAEILDAYRTRFGINLDRVPRLVR